MSAIEDIITQVKKIVRESIEKCCMSITPTVLMMEVLEGKGSPIILK